MAPPPKARPAAKAKPAAKVARKSPSPRYSASMSISDNSSARDEVDANWMAGPRSKLRQYYRLVKEKRERERAGTHWYVSFEPTTTGVRRGAKELKHPYRGGEVQVCVLQSLFTTGDGWTAETTTRF